MEHLDRQHIKTFLDHHKLMALATFHDEPWISTVYYVADDNLNLYFISSPDTKHCKHIYKKDLVACAIYDSHTKNTEFKIGIQMQGHASEVKGWDKIKTYLKMWHQAAPGVEDIITIAKMKNKLISSKVYQIKPRLIKFFNQELYPDQEHKSFKFK